MTTLQTDRLIIRNFLPGDWLALREVILKYQATKMAAFDRPWPTSVEEIKGVTDWFASEDNFLAICLKDSGRLIGLVGLTPQEAGTQQIFELGYVFDEDMHGQGFATEACKAILERAFDELDAKKVVAGTAAINAPSRRLLERLGFVKTGEEKVAFQTDGQGKPIEFIGCNYSLINNHNQDKA